MNGKDTTQGTTHPQDEWRVESYRGLDVYVLVSAVRGDEQQWGYEVRIAQEGADPSDAGDTEVLSSGEYRFTTRHAAEVAAFNAAYMQVDKLQGPQT
ncbi:hypothetical protein K6V92_03575 [Cupriavidus respiraculi]|uniref:hypothetical protein n=1 Tax=Cupriavidus respiraculi TaxID=195930 RepID=UPI001C9562B5|nr:hypothetical protein [Cupriavidus respiraculi]MBY4945701.1 hypothetical protein [Cupriavidus respiraculi]